MRICYLPIFLAVTATVILGISAQNVRVARQLDMSPLTDMVALMGMIMSMMVPTEVMSMFTDSFGQLFSAVPVDFSSLPSLASLGRKRRAVYPWQAQVKKIMSELERVEKMLDGMPKIPEDPEFSFDRGLVEPDDRVRTDETPFFFRDDLNRRFARSPDSGESGGDMQTKGMETAMKGATIAEKGFESGKMASNAGSDVAKSGKAGAEGAAAGAEMMSGAAETISAGAGQGQQMAGSFSG